MAAFEELATLHAGVHRPRRPCPCLPIHVLENVAVRGAVAYLPAVDCAAAAAGIGGGGRRRVVGTREVHSGVFRRLLGVFWDGLLSPVGETFQIVGHAYAPNLAVAGRESLLLRIEAGPLGHDPFGP